MTTAHHSPQGTISERQAVVLLPHNIDNNSFTVREILGMFPPDVIGGVSARDRGRPVTVVFSGTGEECQTDIDRRKKIFRKRGPVGRFFTHHGLAAGDGVLVECEAPYRYRLTPAAGTASSEPAARALGTPATPEDDIVRIAGSGVAQVDIDALDRGTRAHRRTQNDLEAALRRLGLDPRAPGPGEPAYDRAWCDGETVYVAEVKSIHDGNEEQQLRLGLGQLLRYCHQLGSTWPDVRGVIVLEREPSDPEWISLCHALGLGVIWAPEIESGLLRLDA